MKAIRFVETFEESFNVDVVGLDDASKAENRVLSQLLCCSGGTFPIEG
jgi:hypothetical protein